MFGKDDSDDKHRKKATGGPSMRRWLLNIYHGRYQRRYKSFFLVAALVTLLCYLIITYMLPQSHEQTLSLDDERHLFIRLFKDNDAHRKTRRPFRILSGSLHYFRVLPQLWPDRIEQMKKAGLNTIETYVPWNLHEPEMGNYKFNEGLTDLASFLKLVHEHEMFAIVRPSGYICAEWEWGGLPSWLLKDPTMRVRTTHAGFLKAQKDYFAKLLPILSEHQYNRHGPGSIIAFQIENEYGGYGEDKHYLEALRTMYLENGLDELYFTSDGPNDLAKGALDDIWATVNFQRKVTKNMQSLLDFRPKHHLMVMEYWTGWFDYWGGKHKTGADAPYGTDAPYRAEEFEQDLEEILFNKNYEISINFYMFFGGTNFGFTSGGHHFPTRQYSPLVTSYDYDAPLTEAGDPSDKYYAVQRVLTKFYQKHPELLIYNHPRTTDEKFQVQTPKTSKKASFGKIQILGFKTLETLLQDDILTVQGEVNDGPLNMEQIRSDSLPNGVAQGFIVYTNADIQKSLQGKGEHQIKITEIADNAIILADGKVIYTSKHTDNSFEFPLPADTKSLSIFVENMGRINFGPTLDHSRKGILGKVLLNDTIELKKWKIHALEFHKGMSSVTDWIPLDQQEQKKEKGNTLLRGPQLFNAPFEIADENSIQDTYLSLSSQWTKGVAFVNGFNLGRYWNIGPQRTLYIPRELLFKGFNHIQLFELYTWGESIELVDTPVIDA